jgi:hypothetical protein
LGSGATASSGAMPMLKGGYDANVKVDGMGSALDK